MRKIQRVAAKIILMALCSSLSSCQKEGENVRAHETLRAGEALLGESIYQLETPLLNQEGKEIGLDAYKGSPVVVSLFYASCPYNCPLLIQSIQTKVEDPINPEIRSNLRVLLISFDPEKDTPEALKKLAEKRKIDLSRWTLAQASDEGAREIAAVLGVQYRKLPDGSFNHSSVIALLDSNGVIQARVDGLDQPFDPIIEKLQTLLQKNYPLGSISN